MLKQKEEGVVMNTEGGQGRPPWGGDLWVEIWMKCWGTGRSGGEALHGQGLVRAKALQERACSKSEVHTKQTLVHSSIFHKPKSGNVTKKKWSLTACCHQEANSKDQLGKKRKRFLLKCCTIWEDRGSLSPDSSGSSLSQNTSKTQPCSTRPKPLNPRQCLQFQLYLYLSLEGKGG